MTLLYGRTTTGRVELALVAAVASLTVVGCDNAGQFGPSGADEPIVVRYQRKSIDRTQQTAPFFEGDLPTGTAGPVIDGIQSLNTQVKQGQAGKVFSGVTSLQATAIALRLADVGTGYWVVPVDTFDLSDPMAPKLGWQAQIDFAYDLSPGMHLLSAAAVADGSAPSATSGTTAGSATGSVPAAGGPVYGPRTAIPLAVLPDPPVAPLVVSLRWDTNADLDLHLVTPTGLEIYPKAIKSSSDPTMQTTNDCGETFTMGSLVVPPPPDGTGILQHDANAACAADASHQENIVFCGSRPSGTYLVRVDMFSACSESFADFTVRILAGGTEIDSRSGQLLAIDADGGGPGSGLFVLNFTAQ